MLFFRCAMALVALLASFQAWALVNDEGRQESILPVKSVSLNLIVYGRGDRWIYPVTSVINIGSTQDSPMARLYEVYDLPAYQEGFEVKNATLNLNLISTNNLYDIPMDVYLAPSDWDASSTNWSGMPVPQGGRIVSFVPRRGDTSITVDLTSIANLAYQSNSLLSFVIKSREELAFTDNFSTFNNNHNLNITFGLVPELDTFEMMAVGIGLMTFFRKRL